MMNRPSSGKTDHPGPYVWIRSQRLRNPQNPPTPASRKDALPQHRERPDVNLNSSKAENKEKVVPAHKRVLCAMGETGGRRVKTATSDELFQTGIEPAYIDHNGDLMDAAADEQDAINSDETPDPHPRKERPKSCRQGWGVMLPPAGVEEDQNFPSQQQSREVLDRRTMTNLSHTENQTTPTSTHTVGFNPPKGLKLKNHHEKSISINETGDAHQRTASSRPKSAVAAAVDRAWGETPKPLQRSGLTRGSSTLKLSEGNSSRSSPRVQDVALKARRAVSAAPTRRLPQGMDTLVVPQGSRRVRASTARAGQRRYTTVVEDGPPGVIAEGDIDISRIRPLTVGIIGDTAKRYCDQRLQTIYAQRRSRSAVPSSKRYETHGSSLAAPPTPALEAPPSPSHDLVAPPTPDLAPTGHLQGRQSDQSESQGLDGLVTQLLSPLAHGTEEEQARPGSRLSMAEEQNSDRPAPPKSGSLTPLARFRLVVWITMCLKRLLTEIIRLSGEKTIRSATELQWMEVYAEKHDASLAFNKHLFSRDRVMAHVPFWAQSILGIPPVERTEAHCRKLHALLRGLRSFDKFTDEIQMALCKAFILEKVQEGRIVLKNGHVGLNFYFIYSGSVFVNQEDETKQGRVFSRTVATLCRGDSFGELALLQDIRRTATVSVRERCELLTVDKDVFASVCPRIFDKELAEKHAFIKSLDLFSSSYWSSEALHSLSMNSQIQEYKINKIIVGDSSIEDWIYICMFGKCQVIRVLSLKKASPKGEQPRKESDVVLSEEILQLLASAAGQARAGEPLDRGDSKENLLSSLQLDYVRTSKKLYLDVGKDKAQQMALLGLNDATTLTAYIQRQRDLGKTDLVYLNVGVLEAGETFDLPSLLENTATPGGGTSTLMLVSAGARLVRIKKAAFQDQASQQALDNARTLASKQVNPTEKSIIESYKAKIAWEDFKASLVHDVKRQKKMRYQPLHRPNLYIECAVGCGQPKQRPQSAVGSKSSKIISVLQSIQNDGEEFRRQSVARKSLTRSRWGKVRPLPSVIFQRKKSLALDDMRSVKQELVVSSRRKSAGLNSRKICRDDKQEVCH